MRRWLAVAVLLAPAGCGSFKSWRDTVAPSCTTNDPGAGTAWMSSNPDLDGRADTRHSIFNQQFR